MSPKTYRQQSRIALGLPSGIVRLCSHTSAWKQLYRNQELLLREAIGHQLLDVQHVGSTCIPNIKAKPIIDILVGIENLSHAQGLIGALKRIQFDFLGNELVPGHYVFAKGAPRAYLLHVVEHTGSAWVRVIAFRDILINSPSVALRYEALKLDLSRTFSRDRSGYANAKTAFIDSVLETGGQL